MSLPLPRLLSATGLARESPDSTSVQNVLCKGRLCFLEKQKVFLQDD